MTVRLSIAMGLVCLFAAPLYLIASCGSAFCPVDSHQQIEAQQTIIRMDYDYIDQSAVYVGKNRSYPGAIHQHHDEMQTVNQRYALSMHVPISPIISLFAECPFITRQHTHIHMHGGSPLFEKWNFTGLGDLTVGLEYDCLQRIVTPHDALYLSAYLKCPTGVTRMTSAENGEAEIAIQPGSGSYDTTWGMRYQQTDGIFPLFGSALYTCTGRGSDEWRFGNRWVITAGTTYPFTQVVTAGLQLNALIQDKAEAGTTKEDINNTGGKWLFISPGVDVALGNGYQGHLLLQIPIYRSVNGIQLTSDLYAKAGLSLTL